MAVVEEAAGAAAGGLLTGGALPFVAFGANLLGNLAFNNARSKQAQELKNERLAALSGGGRKILPCRVRGGLGSVAPNTTRRRAVRPSWGIGQARRLYARGRPSDNPELRSLPHRLSYGLPAISSLAADVNGSCQAACRQA